MITHLRDSDWIPIAEQVTLETDPAKLAILVEQLCCALDGWTKPALPSTEQNRRGQMEATPRRAITD